MNLGQRLVKVQSKHSKKMTTTSSKYKKMMDAWDGSDNKKVYDLLTKAGWKLDATTGQTLVRNKLKQHNGDVAETAKDIMQNYPQFKTAGSKVSFGKPEPVVQPHAKVSPDAKLTEPFGGPSSKAGRLAVELYDPKKVVHREKASLPLGSASEFIVLKRPNARGGEDALKMYLAKPAQKGQKVGEVVELGTHVTVDGAKAFSYHQGITDKNPRPDHQVDSMGRLVGVDEPNFFDLVRNSNAKRAANRKLYL